MRTTRRRQWLGLGALGLLAGAGCGAGTAGADGPTAVPARVMNERLGRGVNFGNALEAPNPGRAPFRADVVRVRADVALTRRISGGAFLQYASTSAAAAANARLRYNFGEGRDLYIVYNEGLNVRDGETDAPLPLSDSRHLLLKVTYTLPVG